MDGLHASGAVDNMLLTMPTTLPSAWMYGLGFVSPCISPNSGNNVCGALQGPFADVDMEKCVGPMPGPDAGQSLRIVDPFVHLHGLYLDTHALTCLHTKHSRTTHSRT